MKLMLLETLSRQLRASLSGILIVNGLVALILAAVLYAAALTNRDVGDFLRDPASVLKTPFYIGLLSNLTVLFWCSAAVICLFSFALFKNVSGYERWRGYFLYAGLLTAFLCFDDLYLLHEEVLPNIIGVPENLVIAGYLGAFLLFLISQRVPILQSVYIILVLAFGLLGMSLLMDKLNRFNLPNKYLWEDGAKLFGAATWLLYFAHTAYCQTRAVVYSKTDNSGR